MKPPITEFRTLISQHYGVLGYVIDWIHQTSPKLCDRVRSLHNYPNNWILHLVNDFRCRPP